MKQKINILILFLLMLPLVSAEIQVINIPITDTEEEFTYYNLHQSELLTADPGNVISEMSLVVSGDSEDRAVVVYLSNNFTYVVLEQNFYLYNFSGINFLPRHSIKHFLNYKNYTVFSNTYNGSNWFSSEFAIEIDYDSSSYITSFKVRPTLFSSIVNTTDVIGFASSDVIIQSNSSFDIKGLVKNNAGIEDRINKFNSLSNTGKLLYKAVSFILGDGEFVFQFVSLIDLIVWVISLIFSMFFTYPQLIFIYILSFGNIFVAFRSNTLREIIFHYQDYIKGIAMSIIFLVDFSVRNYIPVIGILIGVATVTYVNNTISLDWLRL